MNSKGHLIISILKSAFRILSCVLSIVFKDFVPMAIGFAVAEILGILEELVDER